MREVFDVLIMSDEANFHLSRYVNKQNCRNLSYITTTQIHEKPLNSEHVVVSKGVSTFSDIGSYFFEETKQACLYHGFCPLLHFAI
jgi:hypothetical protein